MVEAHVGDGEYEASRVYAYVYLGEAVHSPHLFIRQAMENACSAPGFHSLPLRAASASWCSTPWRRVSEDVWGIFWSHTVS